LMLSATAGSNKDVLPEGELLRLNEWSELGAWLLACFAFLLGVFLIVVPASRPHHFDGPLRLVLGLVWLGFGLLIAGGARSGLVVDEHGVVVQGLVRRTRWEWSEIAGFVLKPPLFKPALRIQLTDGKEVSTLGFSARSAEERNLAKGRVAELNRRAIAARVKV
jgi:hypothetical protein